MNIKEKNKIKKALIIVGIIVILFLIWAELSVGIFCSPFAGS